MALAAVSNRCDTQVISIGSVFTIALVVAGAFAFRQGAWRRLLAGSTSRLGSGRVDPHFLDRARLRLRHVACARKGPVSRNVRRSPTSLHPFVSLFQFELQIAELGANPDLKVINTLVQRLAKFDYSALEPLKEVFRRVFRQLETPDGSETRHLLGWFAFHLKILRGKPDLISKLEACNYNETSRIWIAGQRQAGDLRAHFSRLFSSANISDLGVRVNRARRLLDRLRAVPDLTVDQARVVSQIEADIRGFLWSSGSRPTTHVGAARRASLEALDNDPSIFGKGSKD